MHRRRRNGRPTLFIQGLLMLPLLTMLGSCASDVPSVCFSRPSADLSRPAESARESVVAISVIIRGGAAPKIAATDRLNGARLAAALEGASRTAGTGFAVAPGGYLLTAQHVVADAAQIWITTSTGAVSEASVVATDEAADLALLHADDLQLPVLEVAAALPAPGQRVFSYGNPGGQATCGQLVYSSGLVAELNCTLTRLSRREHRDYTGMIQSYMPITPGDSGGPLLDQSGRLVGINAAAVLPSWNTSAIGYAFPATPEWLTRVQSLLDSCR